MAARTARRRGVVRVWARRSGTRGTGARTALHKACSIHFGGPAQRPARTCREFGGRGRVDGTALINYGLSSAEARICSCVSEGGASDLVGVPFPSRQRLGPRARAALFYGLGREDSHTAIPAQGADDFFGRSASMKPASTHQMSPCPMKNMYLPSGVTSGQRPCWTVWIFSPRLTGVVHEPSPSR